MVETILKVQGMMCGMCESHINEVVRKTAQVSKVSSSHTKGETVIVSDQALDIETLKQAIAATGYTVTGAETRPYEKKGFFAFCSSHSGRNKGPRAVPVNGCFPAPRSGPAPL